MNFLRRIFSVYHSFRSMCQSVEWKVSKGSSKLKILGADRILRPPAKRIEIKLYELHLGKEKPVIGNIEPLLGITKPAEGLNKPCQGNVNGRKSFAAEGFNVKIPFIKAKHTRKLWRFPCDKVILELVILLIITQGSFLRNHIYTNLPESEVNAHILETYFMDHKAICAFIQTMWPCCKTNIS